MIEGEPKDEVPNRELVKWLDLLRVTHTPTVLLEAHAPHNEKRPYGWSGWKRWPEFGLHLDRGGELTHWRGHAVERPWPEQLRRGRSHEWLWVPSDSGTATESTDPLDDLITQCRLDVLREVRKARKPLTRAESIESDAGKPL